MISITEIAQNLFLFPSMKNLSIHFWNVLQAIVVISMNQEMFKNYFQYDTSILTHIIL